MTSGIYPLLPNTTSIRAVRFEWLPDSDEIRGYFAILDLNGTNHDDYEALSYAWGDPSPVSQITFPGLNLRISVSQNLADGLARLHRDGQTLLIWIDAICIDQRSVEERNQQVRLMGSIFRQAKLVKVWLGIEDETVLSDAFAVLELWSHFTDDDLAEVKPYEKFDPLSLYLSPSEALAPNASIQYMPQLRAADNALNRTFHMPWFERLWTVQEVRTKRSAVVLAGTSAHIDYDTLCGATQWMVRVHPKKTSFLERITWCVSPRLLPVNDAGKLDLPLNAFVGFSTFKASEPRDRVYALLELISIPFELQHFFAVDYNKPATTVFADATRGIIQSTSSLKILRLCDMFKDRSPSWALGWQREPGYFVKNSPGTCIFQNRSKPEIGQSTRSDAIVLKGILCGRIVGTCDNYFPGLFDRTYEETISFYAFCRDFLRDTIVSEQDLIQFDSTFAYVLTRTQYQVDHIYEKFRAYLFHGYNVLHVTQGKPSKLDRTPSRIDYTLLPPATGLVIDESTNHMRRRLEDGATPEEISDECQIFGVELDACKNNTLFLTDEGFLGSGRGKVKTGDQLCAFLGGDQPFVLHPEPDNNWTLIGSTFIDPENFMKAGYREGVKHECRWFSLI